MSDVAIEDFGTSSPGQLVHAISDDEYLLVREMHHRMANILTLLTGLLWSELYSVGTPATRKSFNRCEARIIAFGKLHSLLTVGTTGGHADTRKYVEELCRALSEALLRPIGVRCEVFVSAGTMPSESCERLGLLIAELVTNAAKHAFVGRNDGLVRIDVTKHIDQWRCIVSDNGPGINVSAPNAGTRILEKITNSIGGKLTIRSSSRGTSVMISCRPNKAFAGEATTQ